MNFIQHPSNNKVLGAPRDWDQSQGACRPLPVTTVQVEGRTALVSYWMPSKVELEALNAGKPVELWIHSSAHPPVGLWVEGIDT